MLSISRLYSMSGCQSARNLYSRWCCRGSESASATTSWHLALYHNVSCLAYRCMAAVSMRSMGVLNASEMFCCGEKSEGTTRFMSRGLGGMMLS